MKGYGKSRRVLSCMMAVILTAVFFYAFFPVLTYDQDRVSPSSDMSGSLGNAHQSLAVITLPANDDIGRTMLSQSTFRSWQYWYRYIYNSLSMQADYFTMIALLAMSFINLFTWVNNDLSVVALPIGGHGPPML